MLDTVLRTIAIVCTIGGLGSGVYLGYTLRRDYKHAKKQSNIPFDIRKCK